MLLWVPTISLFLVLWPCGNVYAYVCVWLDVSCIRLLELHAFESASTVSKWMLLQYNNVITMYYEYVLTCTHDDDAIPTFEEIMMPPKAKYIVLIKFATINCTVHCSMYLVPLQPPLSVWYGSETLWDIWCLGQLVCHLLCFRAKWIFFSHFCNEVSFSTNSWKVFLVI